MPLPEPGLLPHTFPPGRLLPHCLLRSRPWPLDTALQALAAAGCCHPTIAGSFHFPSKRRKALPECSCLPDFPWRPARRRWRGLPLPEPRPAPRRKRRSGPQCPGFVPHNTPRLRLRPVFPARRSAPLPAAQESPERRSAPLSASALSRSLHVRRHPDTSPCRRRPAFHLIHSRSNIDFTKRWQAAVCWQRTTSREKNDIL